jgi:sugar phosphate isomerase/epimerase
LPEHQHYPRNNLDFPAVVTAASKAGFQALEPWITEIDRYTSSGGTLKDLGKRIADAGLTVENAIAFNAFLDDDETRRAASMEKLKVDMDKVAQIGGKRIAVPPGNNRAAAVSLTMLRGITARRSRWGEAGRATAARTLGHHPVLGPLSHGIYVTVAAGRADASLLLDVFHLYKSGTPFTALKQINGASLHVMHLNDYPQAADSSTLNDGNRSIQAMASPRYSRSFAICATAGSAGTSRSSCSIRSTGQRAPTKPEAAIEKIRAVVRSALA